MALHTKNSALNGAVHLQVGNNLVHNRGGNGKAVAGIRARLAVYHRVDAHELTSFVDQRTARVACVDGSIRLDEALYTVGTQRASLGRHDSSGYGRSEVEGITHSQHPLAQLQVIRITNLDGGQILGVNLYKGEVCRFVSTDNAPLELTAIVQFYVNLVGLSYHMVVGHDVTILRDDNTRTSSVAVGLPVFALLRLLATLAKAEEVTKEVFEGVLNLHPLRLALYGYGDIHNAINRRLGSVRQVDVSTGYGGRSCHRCRLGRSLLRFVTDYGSSHDAAAQDEGKGAHPCFRFLIHTSIYLFVLSLSWRSRFQ